MTEHDRIRVLLVDDHEVLTAGLASLLHAGDDMVVVATAADLAGGVAAAARHRPDVVVLDETLPDGSGTEGIGRLLAASPGAKVVMLTSVDDPEVLVAAVAAGAVGFVSKARGVAEVVAAVRAAAAGEAALSEADLRALVEAMRRPAPVRVDRFDLTGREREVLELLAQGLTNRAIAEQLFLSHHTVRNHVARLCQKLGARSKLEALVIASREGLVEP